jgi:hypothetical protein
MRYGDEAEMGRPEQRVVFCCGGVVSDDSPQMRLGGRVFAHYVMGLQCRVTIGQREGLRVYLRARQGP